MALTDFAIAAGDFDGDGKSDILWQDGTSILRITLMRTGGTSAPATVGSAAGFIAIGTGDFDGDGKSDILLRNTSTGDAEIWLMNGTTRVGSPVDVAKPAGYTLMGAEDVDGNGFSDLLWQDSTTGAVKATEFIAGLANSTVALGTAPGTGWSLIASTGGG